MSKHTPGPWHISKSGQYIRKADAPGWPAWNIAEINQATDAAAANAHLIVACPDLLAALEEMLRHYATGHEMNPEIKQAREAIKQARGE